MAFFLGFVTILLGWNLQHLSFDFEFEKLFPKNDPDSQFYEIHKTEFEYDNDFLSVIINNDQVFEQSFLLKAKEFEDSLKAIESVTRILSPLSQKHLINGPTGLIAFPLLHVNQPNLLASDSAKILGSSLYSQSFTSDGKSILLHLNHIHFIDQENSRFFLNRVQSLADKLGLDTKLVGKVSAQNTFIDLIRKDFGKFLIGSIILSLTLLLLIFKNLKTALLPFLISFLSLIWLFGLVGLLGIKINLLSSLLPPIIFFTSMSDAVHLLNAIYKSRNRVMKDRLKESVSIVWIPTLLTSVTTAIGFLSLLFINTEPIQKLGVFAAIGILIAFIVTFTFGLIASDLIPDVSERKVIQVPKRLVSLLLGNKLKVIGFILLIILIVVPGVNKLQIDAYLLDDLPKSSAVRENFEYADKYLGGSKPYEVRIDVKGEAKIWDQDVMNEVLKIEEYLIDQYQMARVQSPSNLLKYLNQVNNGGLNKFYQYPANSRDYSRAVSLTRKIEPEILQNLVLEDQTACRIVGFFPEYGSLETIRRNEEMLAYLENAINHSKIEYRITGTTYLIDKSHELLSMNLLKGLFVAVLIISLILGIYFRSLKLLLISLIPNLVPLLIVAGTLGWLGISLKMTTAIIFTIAFGIAVDDTIHMMSYYVRNRSNDSEETLKSTFNHAGSAMLITSIIMIAGFSLFLLSQFGATFYLGLFVSLSLLVALLIDLTLLPILLLNYKRNDVKSR